MQEAFETIVTEARERVGLIRLNRPKQLNALNDTLMMELGKALAAFDSDDGIAAIVITGSEITNPGFHLIAVGINRPVEWNQPASAIIEQVHADDFGV